MNCLRKLVTGLSAMLIFGVADAFSKPAVLLLCACRRQAV